MCFCCPSCIKIVQSYLSILWDQGQKLTQESTRGGRKEGGKEDASEKTKLEAEQAWMHHDVDNAFRSFSEVAGLKEVREAQYIGHMCTSRRTGKQSGLQTQKTSPFRKKIIRLVKETFKNILKQDQVQTNTQDIM